MGLRGLMIGKWPRILRVISRAGRPCHFQITVGDFCGDSDKTLQVVSTARKGNGS